MQQAVVHAATLICGIALFTLNIQGTMTKDIKERQQICCNTWYTFTRDRQAAKGDPNIHGDPPQATIGQVFIINKNPGQIFNVTVQGLGSTFPSPTSTFVPEDNATFILDNLYILPNPDILLPPRAVTPYPMYPGPPPPTYQEDKDAQGNYCPSSPMPEPVEQLGVLPEGDWVCNLKGLEPTLNYLIPGLGGREVVAPFLRFNFEPNMPEVVLT